jgi:hypothetical protein
MFAKFLPFLATALLGTTLVWAEDGAQEPPTKPPSLAGSDADNAASKAERPADRPVIAEGKPAIKADPAAAEDVGRWIKQLDSDEYWTREEASKRLFRAGAFAIEALGEAARSP